MSSRRAKALTLALLLGAVCAAEETLDSTQAALQSAGLALVGVRHLEVGGRRYAMDCTGVVLAAHHSTGIELLPLLSAYPGGGVERLHAAAEERGLLVADPAPGDLVFWDDTYDRDGDGRWNDPLTHVGLVVAVHGSRVEYLHHSYRRGVVIGTMDLSAPDDRERNSAMRMKGTAQPGDPRLSGQLFRAYGRAWKAGQAEAGVGR